MFLLWFDDNRKKPVATKIEEGKQAYTRHFKCAPRVVLVAPSATTEEAIAGLKVVPRSYVRTHNFWFGAAEE